MNFIVNFLAKIGFEITAKTVRNVQKKLQETKSFKPKDPMKNGAQKLIGEMTAKKILAEVEGNRFMTASLITTNTEINHNNVS